VLFGGTRAAVAQEQLWHKSSCGTRAAVAHE